MFSSYPNRRSLYIEQLSNLYTGSDLGDNLRVTCFGNGTSFRHAMGCTLPSRTTLGVVSSGRQPGSRSLGSFYPPPSHGHSHFQEVDWVRLREVAIGAGPKGEQDGDMGS